MTRPNILLIHSDQHRYDCVGGHGHPLLKTPNMDRLAAAGADCTHAFCPNPLCTPARASLLNGQFSACHLGIANFDTEAPRAFREGLPTFGELLNEAGYWLGYVGKWHVHRTKGPENFGFHEFVPEHHYGKWRHAQGLPPRPRKNEWLGELDPFITPEQSKLAWGTDHVLRMLKESSSRAQPFFIRWDPSEPHLANVVPEPYHSLYPVDRIDPWPSYPDPLEGKPYIQKQQLRTWKLDQWTWEDWAPVVSRYLGEISLIDTQLGRILDAVDKLGLAENTIVIYTTDHGDMCGGHGMIDKHFIMYEDVVRVPLTVRWPGRIPAGKPSHAFIASAIDLAATFVDAAGLEPPDTFQGQSLLPLLSEGQENDRDDIFCMYHGNQFGLYSQRMVRDHRWKYVWNATAEDELYDLETDPGELHNRALEPGAEPELRHLQQRLVDWMKRTNDPLLNRWTQVQILEGLTR